MKNISKQAKTVACHAFMASQSEVAKLLPVAHEQPRK